MRRRKLMDFKETITCNLTDLTVNCLCISFTKLNQTHTSSFSIMLNFLLVYPKLLKQCTEIYGLWQNAKRNSRAMNSFLELSSVQNCFLVARSIVIMGHCAWSHWSGEIIHFSQTGVIFLQQLQANALFPTTLKMIIRQASRDTWILIILFYSKQIKLFVCLNRKHLIW